ncbi:dipeptide/oligopeptide/nickel ABC transporter permease/ATP-binding protein [Nonomuraea sp. NPDC059194]|uniref:dipeptide/oligopeptide/nickel ABC transporter permease/ATP-binding protein n=1 Tax=Nonomuraea sp. NPDC059194 TaxID=3346764 RepID=UPI00369B878C
MTTPPTTPQIPGAARRGLLRRIFGSPVAAPAMVVLVLMVLACIFAPLLTPYDSNVGDIGNAVQGSSPEHWLGTDSAGRDIATRLLYGGRYTLGGALLTLAVAMLLGVTSGLVSGFYSRWIDTGAEWVNSLVMALPAVMVLLAVRAGFGNNIWLSTCVLGVILAPGFHRLTRTIVAGVRNELYVDAARVSGLSDVRIIGRHVLNAVRAPIIIHAALTGVTAIGIQAGLDFMGLGSSVIPTWGTLLNEALRNIYIAPGLMLWPGVALGAVNASLILFGNGLRDALEDRPKSRLRKRAIRTAHTASSSAGPIAAMESVAGSHAPDFVPEDSLLAVRGLRVGYPTAHGLSEVVRDVSLGVRPGEVLGLVGESGSGKTQTAWALLDLLPREARVLSGDVVLNGLHPRSMRRAQRRALLGSTIAYIPQEPMSNLDPAFTVGDQLVRPMRHKLGLNRATARAKALSLLDRVGITDPERIFCSYPHQISGGMAQRVLIAGAVSCDPKIIIADEPTTALDVTVQAEVLDLLRDLQAEHGMAMIMVTHNLGVVADICDRVAVMQHGRIVEQAEVDQLFAAPEHPYTQMLLRSVIHGREPRTRLTDPIADVEVSR